MHGSPQRAGVWGSTTPEHQLQRPVDGRRREAEREQPVFGRAFAAPAAKRRSRRGEDQPQDRMVRHRTESHQRLVNGLRTWPREAAHQVAIDGDRQTPSFALFRIGIDVAHPRLG